MKLYLLRHGETDENKSKFYYGKMDVSLNSRGIEQAQKAARALSNIEFDSIYISERKRTIETKDIILSGNLKGYKDMVKQDSRINEMNFGLFEGKTYEEIKEAYPEEYKRWEKDWKNFCPPQGEGYKDFYLRVKCFMEEILNSSAENVLVVTHGGVIRTIYCYILEENLDLFWKFASKNGDISIIKYEYNNIFIDSITHIE
jgi:alpha-ribazole phosphatase